LAAHKRIKNVNTAAAPLLAEYIQRERLAKLGFVSDISRLPVWKAEAFCYISSNFDELYQKDLAQKRKK